MRIAVIAAILVANVLAVQRAFAAEAIGTIVVLDTTAQMATRLGPKRKLDIVRGALGGAVRGLDPASAVALWAFGTHPAQKCEDSRELVPLQPPAKASGAVNAALEDLNPKASRAPALATLSAALKRAGDAGTNSVSAVLIAGAADDCGGDICAAARALQILYPQAKLSVIGMGMAPPAAEVYTCAAKAMGGAFFPVKSASEFDRALKQALATPAPVQLKSAQNDTQETGPAPSAPPAGAPDIPPSAPPPPPVEPNLVLSAMLSEGSSPLESGLTWRITKIEWTPTAQRRLAETAAYTGGGGTAKIKVPEGDYLVEVTYGLAHARGEVTVAAAKAEKAIVLDAGIVAAQGLRANGASPADGAFFTLYRRLPDGGREALGRSAAEPALFYVNRGDYTLEGRAGLAHLETAVTAVPGKVAAVDLALNTGTLEVNAFLTEDRAVPVPAWHRLYGAALDPGAGTAPLAVLQGPVAQIQLPEGNYRLETIYGAARAETALIVTAGQVTSQSVILNAGEVKAAAPSAGQSQGNGVVCSIYEAGADLSAPAVAKAAGSNMSFILKAGAYDIGCQKKGAVSAEKRVRIEVAAGQSKTAELPK